MGFLFNVANGPYFFRTVRNFLVLTGKRRLTFPDSTITTFWSTHDDPNCYKTRFLGSKFHKIVLRPRLRPDPAGKAPSQKRGKGKGGKRKVKGSKDEKGLQCPELLTWKVGNPISFCCLFIKLKNVIRWQYVTVCTKLFVVAFWSALKLSIYNFRLW